MRCRLGGKIFYTAWLLEEEGIKKSAPPQRGTFFIGIFLFIIVLLL